MEERQGIFSVIFEMISSFGMAYTDALGTVFNTVFRKPLLFLWKILKRFIRLFLRGIVLFFAPKDTGKEFADDVTRALKKCAATLFSHPGSFFHVLGYYIKKGFSRYSFTAGNILMWVTPLVFIALFITGGVAVNEFVPALRIEAAGETIGYVESEQRFFEAKNEARSILSASEEEIDFPEINYSFTYVRKNSLTDKDTLCDNLLSKTQADMINACAVFIDGASAGVLYSEIEARQIFDLLLDSADKDPTNYTVSFAEEIEFRMGLYPESAVMSSDEFIKHLLLGTTERFTYITKEGDTPREIANKNLLTVEKLQELNPEKEIPDVFPEGVLLTLERYSSPLTVKEVKSEISSKPVQYDRIEIKSNALYSGSTRVLSQGKPGYAQVTSLVTYIDGVKVSTDEISSITVSEPVPERIQVGTKPLDEAYTNPNGNAMLLWPIIGAYGINSDYGYRWGKLHAGIDLGMGNAPGTSLGKTIIAVAPGTVTTAAVHSSYGYYVIIDHGGGMQTLYAHCLANSLMVVPGQTVVAGQPIARVGSTGYSTGPHLHFEVRINGNRVDPKPYLGISY